MIHTMEYRNGKKYKVIGKFGGELTMEDVTSLNEIIKTVKKYFLLIISLVILAVGIAAAVSYYVMTPIYQASTQILINQQQNEQDPFNTQDIQMNLQLIETYSVIIKSPFILSKVIKQLELDTTPDLLTKKIIVNSEQNSQVVTIHVQDSNMSKGVEIANTTVEILQAEIRTLMNVDNIHVLSPAVQVKNQPPIKPDPILNMSVAGIIGLMLGIGFAFLLEYLDMTVKTQEDVEKFTGLPIIGVVSPISDKEVSQKMTPKDRGDKR